MYVLSPGQDATADPAPAWERERWEKAISAIKEDEEKRARDSEEQRLRAAETRARRDAWDEELDARCANEGLRLNKRRDRARRAELWEIQGAEWKAAGAELPQWQ